MSSFINLMINFNLLKSKHFIHGIYNCVLSYFCQEIDYESDATFHESDCEVVVDDKSDNEDKHLTR